MNHEEAFIGGGKWATVRLVAGTTAVVTMMAQFVPDAALLAPLAAPVLMFNRVQKADTLGNDTRKRIFDYVRDMPGACISDIATSVGVSHSTASYHLSKLVGFNLVTNTVDGNKVRYFVNGGMFSEQERRLLAALDHPETRRVTAMIVANPYCSRAELTALLGVSPPTVSWHLERIQQTGLLEERRMGRNRQLHVDRFRLGRALSAVLGKLQESDYDTKGLRELFAECNH